MAVNRQRSSDGLDGARRVPQCGRTAIRRGHLAMERELGFEIVVQPAAAEKLEQEPADHRARTFETAADRRSQFPCSVATSFRPCR